MRRSDAAMPLLCRSRFFATPATSVPVGLADVRAAVRIAAASALVRLGDPRGIAPLLDALEGELTDRGSAFLAFAPRMPVTFGFDWKAPDAERAEAVARIRAWAAREGLASGARPPD